MFSKDAIVSPDRRKDVLQECTENQTYFICHKASEKSEDVCCKAFYDNFGHLSQMVRIAERLQAVEFVELPDNAKYPSHKEIKEKTNDKPQR